MKDYEALLGELLEKLSADQDNNAPITIEQSANQYSTKISTDENNEKVIPLGISNRHVHLSQSDLDQLFGNDYQLTKLKELSQPGQYACKETIMIAGPKGVLEKVRILGPVRNQSQVEILKSDSFKLGIKASLRLSGDLSKSATGTLIGPKGSVILSEGIIIAKRHIHMTKADSVLLNVGNGDIVTLKITGERGGTLDNVVIRVAENARLECHIDTEEGNAFGAKTTGYIVSNKN